MLNLLKATGCFLERFWEIRALLSDEGTTSRELVEDFHGVIDDYLELCKDQGIEP